MRCRILGTFVLLITTLIYSNCAAESYEDSFSEELFIKPLPTSHLYSYFQFTTKWDVNPEETKCKSEKKNSSESILNVNNYYCPYSETFQLVPESSRGDHREAFHS